MGDVLEVRFRRLEPVALALAPGGLLGLFVYFYASGEWPLWGLLANGFVPAVVLVLLVRVIVRPKVVLRVGARGIEDVHLGLRLPWSEIEAIRVDEHYRHGRRNPWLVVDAGERYEWPLAGATVPLGEIVVEIERWWGRRVSSEVASHGRRRRGARPAGRSAGSGPERPLVVYPARGHWLRWTLFWVALTALAVWLTVDAALTADLRGLLFGPGALVSAWCTYRNLTPLLRRHPHLIIDSDGIRDPDEPVSVRWEDVAEIHYFTHRERGYDHHDLLFELHDYGRFVRRWKARWRPGMSERIPEHPLKLPLGVPTSVAREEIMARIEREWGRPFAGAT